MRRIKILLLAFTAAASSGCSDAEFSVTPLKGTVLCKGRPVAEGLVQFSPIGSGSTMTGKSGAGEIESDGSFVVTTYSQGDGAVVGKCRITAGPNDPKQPWPFKLNTPIEFEVRRDVGNVVIEVLPDGTGKVTPAS